MGLDLHGHNRARCVPHPSPLFTWPHRGGAGCRLYQNSAPTTAPGRSFTSTVFCRHLDRRLLELDGYHVRLGGWVLGSESASRQGVEPWSVGSHGPWMVSHVRPMEGRPATGAMMNKTDTDRQGASPERYHWIAQLLHWGMAAILIYLIIFSSFEEATDAEMTERIRLHTGLGFTIVGLALIRWFWRSARPRPAPVENGPRWQIVAAEAVHRAFYLLFLVAPAFGFVLAGLVGYRVKVFGVFDIAGWLADDEGAAEIVNSFHGLAADVLLVLLLVHVAAALHHQFIKGDGLVWRMLPFGTPRV